MYKDLRLVEFEKREGQFGGILGGFVLMVVGGALLLAGVYASSMVGGALDPLGGGVYINATHYCEGRGAVWNGTACTTGTLTTPIPAGYAPFNDIYANIFDGLAIGGVVVIIIGIVLLISALKSMA